MASYRYQNIYTTVAPQPYGGSANLQEDDVRQRQNSAAQADGPVPDLAARAARPRPYQPPPTATGLGSPQPPTFTQMQQAGEARPPMPDVAPMASPSSSSGVVPVSAQANATGPQAVQTTAPRAVERAPGSLGPPNGLGNAPAAWQPSATNPAWNNSGMTADLLASLVTGRAGGQVNGTSLSTEDAVRKNAAEEGWTPDQLNAALSYRQMLQDLDTAGRGGRPVNATDWMAQWVKDHPLGAGASDPGAGAPPPSPTAGSSGPPQAVPVTGGTVTESAGNMGAAPGTTASNTDLMSLLLNGGTATNPYGTQQVQDAYKWLGGQIDDQYALQQKQLAEEMARRGLSASSINAGRLADLNVGQRSAKEALAENLGQNMANAELANRGSNLNWLQSLMGYGQQGFNNDLATAAFNQNQNQSWQDFLLKMLGMGYSPTGA